MVVRNSRSLLLACTAMFVFGAGIPAFSQSPEEEAASQKTDRITPLKKIVVGAGQRKVAIDTPQAVTVLDQKDIDDTQAETIGDVFRDVPGVSIAGSERVFGEAFNIRGIGSTEDSADGSRIVVNVDGAQKFYEQYRMGSFFSDPELYKSVEVLRGPASSTLYGAGALGGVINFTTKDASDFLQDGNDNALRLKGSYESNGNGYLASTIFAHRFNDSAEFLGMINKRGSSEIELGNGTDLSGSDFQSWSGLAKTTFHLGDEQTVRLSYQHWDSDANDQDYAQTGTQSAFGTVDRHVIDDTAVVNYEDPFSDNPWLDLKASLSYSNTKVDQSNGTLGGFSNIIDADYGYQTWQANLQNTSEFSGDNWVNYLTYGTQLSHQERTADSPFPGGTTPGAINTHPEGTDNKIGLFVQNEFIYDERLTLIGGVRGDFVWREPGDSTRAYSNAVDIDDQAFSPKIAAHYKLTDEWGVFGSIAHTERLPTLDELYTWSKGTSLDLKKEKSNNYEVGFAFSHDDLFQSGDNISLKTTAFYNDLTNLISTTATGASSYYYNVGKARIYGVEVEGAYDSDYVFAKLAYTGTQGQDRSDGVNYNKPLPTVPAHKIAFTLGGRLPDQDIEYGTRVTHAFEAQNSVRGTAASSGSTANHTVVPNPDWTTVDVFASWRPQTGEMQGWQVQASINNIFDQYYRENTALDYAKGRTFKVTLTKQLDW
ncbi:TonB-dependent hemoglobin/transferrin/lactoferrin family receptor [Rhizobium sp. BG4]|uniref:TonB-dependent hemoglobin/transferrin/lactoferrin family receptor n=1 Tax=Rhizobium sp. BG4 TaxID=2613770 RepID=UPI00193D0E8D|nr:TonB-dependent hemoglobin/transferrin/lactoferrin family receptor [Rhizobium sp. BG4]